MVQETCTSGVDCAMAGRVVLRTGYDTYVGEDSKR